MDAFSDLRFFSVLMKNGSLAAAAQELGVTAPAVSRRLALLEKRLGVRLLQRTTRRIHLTPEGETYLQEGARVLHALDALESTVSGARSVPRGPLRIAATLGFGRERLAPALSAFSRRYPLVDVQLHLTERPVNLVEQGFDAVVRFGDLPDSRLTARKLLANERVVCASPSYLASAGEPRSPAELAAHRCIVLREADETYGTWHFSQGERQESVKVRGPLSTNDGATALAWALDDQGILLRSVWDIQGYLQSGQLRQLLSAWRQAPADVYLVHPTRSELSAKTRALSEFLREWFAPAETPRTAP